MAQIKNETEYRAAMKRIDELLPITGDEWPSDDPNMNELVLLSELVEEYENIHYPIETPSLVETIKTRLFEMKLSQKAAAELLGISAPQFSEIIRGKAEPSLPVARNISRKLNIEPAIVLGV
jgi:HTH-type transcriptional regulator/antitoxin HigA